MNQVFAWPVGQDRRFSSDLRYALLYNFAAILGGASLGAALVVGGLLLRQIPRSILLPIATIVAFAAVCLQLTGKMGWFPERKAQVPSEWLQLSPTRYSVAFGGMLGFAVLTFLHHAVWYALFAALVVRGDALLAIATGTVFGLVRGAVPIILRVVVRAPSDAEARRRFLASSRFGLVLRLALVAAGAALVIDISGLVA